MMAETTPVAGGSKYRIAAGAALGDVYTDLFKRYNVTLPGGTCGTVAAGGHISGGGDGLLSRLHGLASGWLSAGGKFARFVGREGGGRRGGPNTGPPPVRGHPRGGAGESGGDTTPI